MKNKFKHYHMCHDCAVGMGGEPMDYAVTVIKGICKYCEWPTEQMLIPWVDFNWPKDKQADKSAKLNRD